MGRAIVRNNLQLTQTPGPSICRLPHIGVPSFEIIRRVRLGGSEDLITFLTERYFFLFLPVPFNPSRGFFPSDMAGGPRGRN